VIAYPAPNSGEFARAIAENSFRLAASRSPSAPMRRTGSAQAYQRAADEIAGHLDAGRDVAVDFARAIRSSTARSWPHDALADRFRQRLCRA
jgi:hypothetical protein